MAKMRPRDNGNFKGINEVNKKNQLKIGIDARFYGPRQKGLGRYVQKLIEELERTDKKNKYIIFLRQENWNEYQPANPNFKKVLANAKWYGIKEQILMPFKIKKAKVDLVHFPHFNVPLFCPVPFVVTIHDLILKKFPTRRTSTLSPIRYWLKNIAYQIVISSALKRARKIITVSDYTKKDILKYFKINPGKIEVIYEGASAPMINLKSQLNFKKFGISKPYLLYVGNAYPHKNLKRLILAFKELKKEKDLQLILVGEMDHFYKRLKKFIHNSLFIIHDSIIFTDFVSDKELSALYQNASCYVFPSLCEGFGLPPLEAMSLGLPVVSSSSTCLPEILGQAAIYFNPENPEEIAQKIKQVLDSEKLQKELVSLGFEKIKEYNWQKMGKKTFSVYRAVD